MARICELERDGAPETSEGRLAFEIGLEKCESAHMAEVAIAYHEDFLKHVPGPGHPESPDRLRAIVDKLSEEGLIDQLAKITPEAASERMLVAIHKPDYIRWVQERCRQGERYLDAGDTMVCPDSYRVALLAAGAVTEAAEWVTKREGRRAFCAVRPPGHHAEANRAMGFCLFNNVAICARHLQRRHNVDRVLIVDWDVHHGNGTQNAFYGDPSVFYFSIHQYPYYPGTGRESDTGIGKGEGYTMNVPLPAGSGDEEYLHAFREKLLPAAESFEPEVVLISAGFDSHRDDPLAGMCLTEDGFAKLTELVKGIADRHSGGKVISVLEGGYALAAMPASIVRHLRVLME